MNQSDLTMRAAKIRETILKLSHHAKSAHVGSSLSCVEILVACFETGGAPNFDNATLVLSKGHAAMSLYATAVAYGLLPETVVQTYLKDGTDLWGHPSVSNNHKFIHWSTGSLGHGLPVTCGFAYASQLTPAKKRQHLVILSDGELDEGSNWEAILFAGHHKLSSVTAIVDYNKIQSFGRCVDVMNLEPLTDKWNSFGWEVIEVDGHDTSAIVSAIKKHRIDKPRVLIAHTVKGKGVSEYEDTIESHYKPVSADILSKYVKSV